jgi:hypothetical protein
VLTVLFVIEQWKRKKKVQAALAKVAESPGLVLLATGACIVAIPATMAAFAVTAISVQVQPNAFATFAELFSTLVCFFLCIKDMLHPKKN